jgi:hypothetical protein
VNYFTFAKIDASQAGPIPLLDFSRDPQDPDFDPIRPTHGHTAISPHGGLFAMPSLCGSASATREWFRAFTAQSVLTCRPL